jgi:hypothetical protein
MTPVPDSPAIGGIGNAPKGVDCNAGTAGTADVELLGADVPELGDPPAANGAAGAPLIKAIAPDPTEFTAKTR